MHRMRKKENQLHSTSQLAGFAELRDADQQKLEKMLADFHDPEVDFPPAKPKKKRKDEEGVDAEEKPKKKAAIVKKAQLPPIEPESRECSKPAELKALANELVDRCRKRGLNVPTDDAVARQKLGSFIMEARKDGVIDVAACIQAADKEFGAKKSVDAECPANAGLALAFTELGDAYAKLGDRMRSSAYKKVAATIAEQTEPITSGKGCKNLPGIGKASVEKIDEYLQTGTIAKLDELKNA